MITLRPTEEADLPRLSRLYEDRFDSPLDPDAWIWKYRLLPGVASSLVAEDSRGELVAHAGALRLPSQWRGGNGGIWQLVDFMGTTRRGGLLPPMVRVGRRLLADLAGPEDAPWIFGFPGTRHFRLGERVFGYRPLALIRSLAAPLPASQGADPSAVSWADHCGDWAQEVWTKCGLLGVDRTTAFLNWRYHARPDRYYRFYRLRSGLGEGLAVFAFRGHDALAAELWLPPDRASGTDPAGLWRSALLAVAADLRQVGMKTWRFWPPADPGVAALLAELGLCDTEETLFLGCCGPAENPAEAARGFHFSMGDYDVI